MSTKRPRNFDFNKPITRYDKLADFQAIKVNDFVLPQEINGNQTKNCEKLNNNKNNNTVITTGIPEIKKKIEIPLTTKIQNPSNYCALSALQKKRKHDLGYIRIKQEENLPHLNYYELTDQDYQFLSDFQFDKEANKKLTQKQIYKQFGALISFYELNSGKNSNITWQEAQQKISNESQDEFSCFTQEQQQEFHTYWENQRKINQRPLLRQFQHANTEDPNPQLAFRPRGQEKMKLRGKNKSNDQDILRKFQSLKEEFYEHDLLFKCIRAREHLKFEQVMEQNNQFMEQVYKLDKNANFKYLGKFDCKSYNQYEELKKNFYENYFKEKESYQSQVEKTQEETKQHLQKLYDLAHPQANGKNSENSKKNQENSQKSEKKQSQLESLPVTDPKFDLAAFMSALIGESKLNPQDIFQPGTINDKKHPNHKQIEKQQKLQQQQKEKIQQKMQKKQLEDKQMEAQQQQQQHQQQQKQQQIQQQQIQKQLEKSKNNQEILKKRIDDRLRDVITQDLKRNPYQEFLQNYNNYNQMIKERKNFIQFFIYKMKSRSGQYYLYRTFRNLTKDYLQNQIDQPHYEIVNKSQKLNQKRNLSFQQQQFQQQQNTEENFQLDKDLIPHQMYKSYFGNYWEQFEKIDEKKDHKLKVTDEMFEKIVFKNCEQNQLKYKKYLKQKQEYDKQFIQFQKQQQQLLLKGQHDNQELQELQPPQPPLKEFNTSWIKSNHLAKKTEKFVKYIQFEEYLDSENPLNIIKNQEIKQFNLANGNVAKQEQDTEIEFNNIRQNLKQRMQEYQIKKSQQISQV